MKTDVPCLIVALALVALPTAMCWDPSDELGFWEHGLAHEERVHENFWLAWEAEDEYLTIAMAAPSEGWISFAPSNTGSMIGANFLVVHQVGTEWVCWNMHSEAFDTPMRNGYQNCELLSFNQANGETYAQVRRPIIGCLPEDMHITDENTRAIWAFGYVPTFSYHGTDNRGPHFLNLISGPRPHPPEPDDLLTFDAKVGPFEMPAYRDVYYCTSVELPHDKKYHVYWFEPLVDHLPHKEMSHHMILWECQSGHLNPDYPEDEARRCSGAGGVPGCNRFWTGWAIGQGNEHFPEEAGLPMGQDNGARYAIFEAHYDNPRNLTYHEPGMGLRLHYSDVLREHDAGVLLVASAFAKLPVQDELIDSVGECSCLTDAFSVDEPTWVIGMAWHMHTYGRKAYLQLVRDGVELDWPLSRYSAISQESWDFNLQGQHDLYRPFPLYKGDRLINHCVYDTSDHDGEYVRFGEGTGDEMCTNFLVYYPRPGLLSTCAGIGIGGICDGPGTPISFAGPYTPLPPPPSNCGNGTVSYVPREENKV